MCGIYGWQWRHDNKPSIIKRTILASTLGLLNDRRGGDSWGWYSLNTGEFKKGLGDVAFDARHAAHHDSLLAHTRKATVGKVSIDNAHPWKFGSVVGAHNGGVYNHHELNQQLKDEGFLELEVDSMHIFDCLSVNRKLIGVRGYGSIEWTDDREEPGIINLLRASTSASLRIAVTPNGVVWSSEIDHLKAALALSGIGDFKQTLEPKDKIVYRVVAGRLKETDVKMGFDAPIEPPKWTPGYSSGVYGSQGVLLPSARPTPPANDNQEPWRPTKSIRKTIGRAVAKLPPGVAAYICGDCYREVDEQKKCPRGHSGGVLVVKDAATGPVA